MRLSTITAFLLIVQSSLIYASDIDIDAQIERIRQAPENQRFQLVNELKQQIAQMNANQQARAIAKYQEETLNAQQDIATREVTIDNSNIVNQANQEVIKNQLQQEQEHQIIIPPVENIQDNQQNFNDTKDIFIPNNNSDNFNQNPVKDITDDIQQPEIIKDLPKNINPINNQQQSQPTQQQSRPTQQQSRPTQQQSRPTQQQSQPTQQQSQPTQQQSQPTQPTNSPKRRR